MRVLFADTVFFIARLIRSDSLHQRAEHIAAQLSPFHLVTSEMVFTELLNEFGDRPLDLRRSAEDLVGRLQLQSSETPRLCTVVPQTHDQFVEAFHLYKQMSDKSWSFTDCASCLLMRSLRISEALTHDRHFEQMGFRALLRADA